MLSNKSARKQLAKLLSRAVDGIEGDPISMTNARSHVIGITGAAAEGKSTLTDKLIKVFRGDKKEVIVLAIDPSLPEGGGAFLGDRIRMRRHFDDEGVFIRSLGSRGAGNSGVRHLDRMVAVASGFADIIIVESPGAGQADLGIRGNVDTFIFLPEIKADAINLMKAGIHEYAHILVLNIRKNREEEAEKFAGIIDGFCREIDGWEQQVFKVNASTGEGVEKLVREGIYKHAEFIGKNR